MNKDLQKCLVVLDQVGFHELELAIRIARMARALMAEYALSDQQLAEEIGIKPREVKRYKTGAYPYSVHDLACLEAAHARYELDKRAKELKDHPIVEIAKG